MSPAIAEETAMLVAGTLLQDRYRIERTLGQGGMGGVYLATHLSLNTPVAIKELHPTSAPGAREMAVRRFRSEAQILSQLQHPGLPRVYDFFEVDGQHYLVMDFILGETLEARLSRDGRISEARVLGWAQQLCEVLHFLHTQDPPVVFRDLKPSNIMITEEGRLKLIDFGIAKLFDAATGEGTDAIARGMGTPGFAAPEQYTSGTDARTDVYALGATLYTLLTGQTPASSLEVAMGSTTVTPLRVLNPHITERTVRAINEMMEPNRMRRTQSVMLAMEGLGFPPVHPASMPALADDDHLPEPIVPERPGVVAVAFATLLVCALVTMLGKQGYEAMRGTLWGNRVPAVLVHHVPMRHPIPPPMEGRGVLVRFEGSPDNPLTLYLDAYREGGKKYFILGDGAGLTREQAVFRIGQMLISTHRIDADSSDWMENSRDFEAVSPGTDGHPASLNEILDRLEEGVGTANVGPGFTAQYRGAFLHTDGPGCPFFRIEAAPGPHGALFAFDGHSGLTRPQLINALARALSRHGTLDAEWTPDEQAWICRGQHQGLQTLTQLLDTLQRAATR
ncbi:MAG: serine/threonine-protein kinase [Candidatus Xenobia bacterium]